jgi:glutamate carboxypeptidase
LLPAGEVSFIAEVLPVIVRLMQPEDYTVRLARRNAADQSFKQMKNAMKSASAPQPHWRERLRYFEMRQDELLSLIRELVEIESPSDNKAAVDRMGAFLAEKFAVLGGNVRFHQASEYGNNLQIDFPGREKVKPALVLGHFDTVYSLGTLPSMPCRVENGKMYGPGVFDMKSGIALMFEAVHGLQTWNGTLPRPVTIFLVSDEEVGSCSSRSITESLARRSAGVLVLEPAAGARGAVKTARKGVGDYILRVKGIAAHAGLDPGKGHSAILELARQLTAVSKLNDLRHGVSVNPGIIRGGTRTNVVAAEATAEIDVRISHAKQARAVDKKLRSLKPVDKHCKISFEGGINRMPMERNAGVIALYKKAQSIAKQIGWKLEEAAVGGGSDGNFTAALGIPTLDGLGGVGQGAHAIHEHIVISELPRRALLLAGLIESA